MLQRKRLGFTVAAAILCFAASTAALGSSCTVPLSYGTAAPGDPYWLENISHQGIAPFASASYRVFRNVKDFGAVGDGIADDTAAINAAIQSGDRCTLGCAGESTTPALVYFPQGVYRVMAPIISVYYTEMVGDARHLPTILADSNFTGSAVIDADPYGPNGNWYVNQNNFYRSVRNLRIDLTEMPANSTSAVALHWQVSQATSLYNIVVDMSTASDTTHKGILIENGSGGFMGDLVFNGGLNGLLIGNQQFTVRNATINNAQVAVSATWNWAWTFQGLEINNCDVGFDMALGTKNNSIPGVGSESFIDVVVTDTPIFLRTSNATSDDTAGSIVLNNIELYNVSIAIGVKDGETVLAGGTKRIDSWVQGDVFTGTDGTPRNTQGPLAPINRPLSLLDASGRIFGKTRPTYADYSPSDFVSVKNHGAKGDGRADDTSALQAVFDRYAGCKIIYFDAGIYIISETLHIPADVQVIGEAWSTIMAAGSIFADAKDPVVAVQVGTAHSKGIVEFGSMLFSTRAPAGGAILMEWNVREPSGQQGAAGMWDTLFRIGGTNGTNMQTEQCGIGLNNTGSSCMGAYLGLHLTPSSTAYLEGTWVWAADHDIEEGGAQISVFSGRGIYSQSKGPVWMIGTAEHHVIYQYNLVDAADHYIGVAQTETPYFQPVPMAPAPFSLHASLHDPEPSPGGMAWAMNVESSSDILIFGAGFYSFYSNYTQDCIANLTCQSQIFNVDSGCTVSAYSVSTIGTEYSLSVSQDPVIPADEGENGFADEFAAWTMQTPFLNFAARSHRRRHSHTF